MPMTVQPSRANARAQIATLIKGRSSRPPFLVAAMSDLVSKWSLKTFDGNTFGFLGSASVDADVSIGAGSQTATSPNNPWSPADVGKAIDVQGAGTGGGTLSTTISAFVNSGQVTLAAAASTSVSASSASDAGLAVWGVPSPVQVSSNPLTNPDGSTIFEPSDLTFNNFQASGLTVPGTSTFRTFGQRFGEWVNARDFGAVGDGVTDDSASISSACSAAVTKGGLVYFPSGTYLASTLAHSACSKCIFIGEGTLKGLHHKRIIPVNAPSLTVSPQVSFEAMAVKASPVAVLIGDSVSTYSANTFSRQGCLADSLEKMLRERLSPTVQFYDRAIGGAIVTSPLGVAADTTPSWYTNPLSTWISYVQALAPDIVFISFGMNDGVSMDISGLDSLVSAIQAFAKVPQIVFCTCLGSSLSDNFESSQTGREAASGLVRTYALYKGFGLLDFGRQHNIARDGYDPCLSVPTGWPGVDTPALSGSHLFTFPEAVYDFWIGLNINSGFTTGQSITVKIGAGTQDWLTITNNGGFYRFELQSCSGTSLLTTTTSVSIPATTVLRVEKSGNMVAVYDANGSAPGTNPYLFLSPTVAKGGYFVPFIQASNALTFISACYYSPGVNAVSMPTATDYALWGDGVNQGTGGSGTNHPGNDIGKHVYIPVLDRISPISRLGSVEMGLRDVVVSSVTRVSNFNVSETYDPLPDSSVQYQAYEVSKATTFRSVIVRYVSTNAGSAGNARIFCNLRKRAPGAAITEINLNVGAVAVDPTGLNIMRTIKIPNASGLVSADAGDILTVARNGSDGTDTLTQEFRVVGITLSPT